MNVNICVVPAYFQKLRCILRGPIFQDNDKIFMEFNFSYNRAWTNILQNYYII